MTSDFDTVRAEVSELRGGRAVDEATIADLKGVLERAERAEAERDEARKDAFRLADDLARLRSLATSARSIGEAPVPRADPMIQVGTDWVGAVLALIDHALQENPDE